MTHENITPKSLWYDPKSQRIVVVQLTSANNVYYRDLGEDLTKAMHIGTFLRTFEWQSPLEN